MAFSALALIFIVLSAAGYYAFGPTVARLQALQALQGKRWKRGDWIRLDRLSGAVQRLAVLATQCCHGRSSAAFQYVPKGVVTGMVALPKGLACITEADACACSACELLHEVVQAGMILVLAAVYPVMMIAMTPARSPPNS